MIQIIRGKNIFEIYIFWLLITNIIAILLYFLDKNKEIKHRYRIKESILLGITILGGSLGTLIGLYGIRHKNKHWYFVLTTYLSLVLHIVIGIIIITKFVSKLLFLKIDYSIIIVTT